MRPLLLILLLPACNPPPDPDAAIAPSAAACKREAQRCHRKDGTVGICQRPTADQPFQCTPQH